MPRRYADLKHEVFARHSNPWSAWTRWLSTPLVLVPLWTRRWSHAAIVGSGLAANPVIFPKPADEHAWSTRVVLGEEVWITERPRDTAMAVDAAATLAGITALIAARRRRAVSAACATAVMMALILVYWRFMADYYNRRRRARWLEPFMLLLVSQARADRVGGGSSSLAPAERRMRSTSGRRIRRDDPDEAPARARLIATQVLGFSCAARLCRAPRRASAPE